MKFLAALLLLNVGFSALAEPPPVLHIEQIDPMVDIDKMKGPNVQVHKAAEIDAEDGLLPDPAKRDALIAKAGLGGLTKTWDEYDLDKFYLNAKSLSTELYYQKYPEISKRRLKAFRKLVLKTKLARR